MTKGQSWWIMDAHSVDPRAVTVDREVRAPGGQRLDLESYDSSAYLMRTTPPEPNVYRCT